MNFYALNTLFLNHSSPMVDTFSFRHQERYLRLSIKKQLIKAYREIDHESNKAHLLFIGSH